MFEQASRLKLRFETNRVGNITVEDLWDLPLLSLNETNVCLDDLAKAAYKDLKESGEESFVIHKTSTDTVSELKLDILKHVIKIKLEEMAAKEKEAENRAKKAKILDIISDKEDDKLKNTSINNLRKMLNEL